MFLGVVRFLADKTANCPFQLRVLNPVLKITDGVDKKALSLREATRERISQDGAKWIVGVPELGHIVREIEIHRPHGQVIGRGGLRGGLGDRGNGHGGCSMQGEMNRMDQCSRKTYGEKTPSSTRQPTPAAEPFFQSIRLFALPWKA